MKEFDPISIKEIKITVIDEDGKRWEIDPEYWEVVWNSSRDLVAKLASAKITGPYSDPKDPVKIAGVVPLKE